MCYDSKDLGGGTTSDRIIAILTIEDDGFKCSETVKKSKEYIDKKYFYTEAKNTWELALAQKDVRSAARLFDECAERFPIDSNIQCKA